MPASDKFRHLFRGKILQHHVVEIGTFETLLLVADDAGGDDGFDVGVILGKVVDLSDNLAATVGIEHFI